jgi:hypothetical protein
MPKVRIQLWTAFSIFRSGLTVTGLARVYYTYFFNADSWYRFTDKNANQLIFIFSTWKLSNISNWEYILRYISDSLYRASNYVKNQMLFSSILRVGGTKNTKSLGRILIGNPTFRWPGTATSLAEQKTAAMKQFSVLTRTNFNNLVHAVVFIQIAMHVLLLDV